MTIRLLSHVNGDSDIIESWCRYYLRLGIRSIHVIAHGGEPANPRLYALRAHLPIHIEDEYDGEFLSEAKLERLNRLLRKFVGQWIVVADSDEFVEFPLGRPAATVRWMRWRKADAIAAPMLQRIRRDGSLDSAPVIPDPFEAFPLCVTDLYSQIGAPRAALGKFPLMFVGESTQLHDAGNHWPPRGSERVLHTSRGVTHHFKWRSQVRERLERRAHSRHSWRGESAAYLAYLETHDWRLPTEHAFPGTRRELVQRGLLVTPVSPRLLFSAVRARLRPSGVRVRHEA